MTHDVCLLVQDASVEGPVCGLIPLGGAARVTTSGLKWNLGNKNNIT
jgi:hypothetical protein